MSQSIMSLADDILGGALSNPSKAESNVSPISSASILPNSEPRLPDITDEQRMGMISESMGLDEKLGPELKKHATQGTTSYSPASSEKDTKISPDAEKDTSLSPKAKAKLKSHRQRKSSKQDSRTSWAVDRPQSHQRQRWQSEDERQRKHRDSRGTKTRGAKPAPSGSNTLASMDSRKAKLSKAGQEKMAANEPAHRDRRAKEANAQRAQNDAATREKWRKDSEERRRKQGVKVREMENSNLQVLLRARDILRELTAVGSIGTKQSSPGMRASLTQDNQGKPMGKDMVPVAPVDKSLRKTMKKKGSKKKKAVKKESFDLFLDRIINETQK